jgi:SPP1 gp7 family putative phage head morphogenesis protein
MPQQPDSVEQEYVRALLLYQREYQRLVKANLPRLLEQLRAQVSEETPQALAEKHARMDADAAKSVQTLFDMILGKMEKQFPDTILRRWAKGMASRTNKLAAKNQAKHIRRATRRAKEGPVEIGGILTSEKKLAPYFKNVVDENVALIRSIPQSKVPAFKNALTNAITQDLHATEIAKIIRKHFAATDSHARLIARDQVGKLNGALDQYHQQMLGCKRYTWRTMKDGAVRGRNKGKGFKGPDHWHLEGEVCSWDKPPVVNTKTGKRAHPKQDFQCRCYAEAVLDDILDEK